MYTTTRGLCILHSGLDIVSGIVYFPRSPSFEPTMDEQALDLDPFEQYFLNYVKTCAKDKSVAILGIAYYGRVIDSIFRDTEVGKLYIVDLLQEKLSVVKNALREPDYPRCILIPSNALDLNFSPSQFQAILASEWLNSLPHSQVAIFIQHCFDWLAPGGELFVSVGCHHVAHIGLHLMDVGEEGSDKNRDFKGDDFHAGSGHEDREHSINRSGTEKKDADVGAVNHAHSKPISGSADVNDLTGELIKVGFTIDKCGHVSGHKQPEHWQHWGQRHVVAVGRKPLGISGSEKHTS
ncbi:hypothetical protein RvY_07213 [Ramazzottius varieornatus]|uniref:Methyltransferase domain-containing protein n=1 Tax=Ramazzottius varieornatus TaxID=947166 RepID=A0A1D1V197_RAMVA|nr:hypothetical protein RvY_07213 [Ramazzottius varieornatus]